MTGQKKPKILIFCDYYLPGYKSGGGMRTIVNMIERLHTKFDFRVVTRDHDGKADKTPYKGVRIDDWNNIGNAQVYYLSQKSINLLKFRELIFEVEPDLIYFNSYFATLAIYVLILRRLTLLPQLSVVLAPCGELSAGALELKSLKKKIFIAHANLLGLYKNVIWKASSELEKREIERVKGSGGKILIAPDLPPRGILEKFSTEMKPRKIAGEAKMVFLSRFARKKNFKFLLEKLSTIEGDLTIDIWGPIEEKSYWEECLEIIKSLPASIKIEARGTIPHENVPEMLLKYHFFILPTLGENFGHVFLEALAAGCPLIISDRTPWLDLEEKGIGWDLELETPEEWTKVLNQCLKMDEVTYSKLSNSARHFVLRWLSDPEIEENTLTVLKSGLTNGLS